MRILSSFSQSLLALALTCRAFAADPEDSKEYWLEREARTLERLKSEQPVSGPAKNIILFLGDGMGITTITAARIMAGQRVNPAKGEEHELNMDKLPYTALSRTYSVNQQTPDSAPTMTAIISGVKTKDKLIGVGPSVVQNDHTSVNESNRLQNMVHHAKRLGKSVGLATNTRLTHATPASCYAHSPDRDWEDDADVKANNTNAFAVKYPDIARQLIEFSASHNLPQIDVALGGGRAKFLPKEGTKNGKRLDGRNLTAEWTNNFENARYVSSREELLAVQAGQVDHLLGLFSDDHMEYNVDRDTNKEPRLVEMMTKALEVLEKNDKGYFLMVEGGRIDHGHHAGNALRALDETIEFDEAIGTAMKRTDPKETLIIVTADHSHTLTMGGYAQRGNPILGLVKVPKEDGTPGSDHVHDHSGRPFTSLLYANGAGYTGTSLDEVTVNKEKLYREIPEGPKSFKHEPEKYLGIRHGRPLLTPEMVADKKYLQEAAVPLGSETHGGEDVAILARGPWAHLFRGVREQNYVYQVMRLAFEAPQP